MRLYTTILSTSLFLFASSGWAASYSIDSSHSQVGFKVKHLFSKVPGRFTKFSGTFDFEANNVKNTGNFNIEIDASSINTDNEKRDEHLRQEDFFHVSKHPKLTFKSTKVTAKENNQLVVTGDLTMRGVTKPVDLDFEYLGSVKDPWGNDKAGFQARTTIQRKDWGISWNKALDAGGFLVGDEVEIEVLVEAGPVKEEKK